ncbi:MAG: phosphate ABC transporter permease PstA [Pseudohongiellaceae bacterium]
MKKRILKWSASGRPWIWLNAAAISISVLMVVGLISLLGVRGMAHFWPSDILRASYVNVADDGQVLSQLLIGELVEVESVPVTQLETAGIELGSATEYVDRLLIKQGNRELFPTDFVWVLRHFVKDLSYPPELVTLERQEWGNLYGTLVGLAEGGEAVAVDANGQESLWKEFLLRLDRVTRLRAETQQIQLTEIQAINYQTQQLDEQQSKLSAEEEPDETQLQSLQLSRRNLQERYEVQRQKLLELDGENSRDTAQFKLANGDVISINLATVVRAYKPNKLSLLGKLSVFFSKVGEFLSTEPREANTEGGVFPAIFGTVMMVLLMSVFVTPFGVIAAVYLREYARQGLVTRIIRIAVNNLAGVPSIVYGVFGLGFFIYIIGGEIDQLFYSSALPAPTFGTPGLLWASLTLALLTVPVVIVATEEGLSRIPRSVREGSMALGATEFETLWRVVLPMASPAMITGLILAVARAAGEVAPLMLVGVVKLAPSLPVDGYYPYLHLDQKFMHLGFHIYDVGFQSSNIEAARPLVYATAFLLVMVIAALNLSAVALRNHLREKYKSLEA